jgi:hypothetical protein
MEEGTTKELVLSDNPDIRRVWHNNEWYYVVVDTIAFLLPDNKDPGGYWRYLKSHLRDEEGADLLLNALVQFKLKAKDERFRLTDTCNLTAVFRLLQSIPMQFQEMRADIPHNKRFVKVNDHGLPWAIL